MRKVKKNLKKMGRPVEADAMRSTLVIRVTAQLRREIAKIRGKTSESEFVRRVLQNTIGG